jgi:hypothetical protein
MRDRTEGDQNREIDEDEIEEEMAASGRHAVVPREGLVGAHRERRAGLGSAGSEEPVGPGADVAPTRRAEARERERHRLQRERAAGTREELDRAAADADRFVAEGRRPSDVPPARLRDQVRLWVLTHPRQTAIAAVSSVVLGVGLGTYFAVRRR